MTAPHRTLATLVAMVAMACDIADVTAPSLENPDAPLSLMPEDRAQGLADQLNALGTIRLRKRFLRYIWTPNEVQDMLVARYGQTGLWHEERERDEERGGDENREGETAPAIARIVPQSIVESDSPREPDLALADEPLVRVGAPDGPMEYLFGDIAGGHSAAGRELRCRRRAGLQRPQVRRLRPTRMDEWRTGPGTRRVPGPLAASGMSGR